MLSGGPTDVPTLLLVGGETLAPGYVERVLTITAAFPRLCRGEIVGQRHLGHVMAPDAFAAAGADFLG